MSPAEVGLLSAGIAAAVSLVVAVITHMFNRNREHEKWHLERLYEATASLTKRFEDLDDALFASPAFLAAKYPGAYPHPLLDEEPHVALVKSSRAYQDSLTVLELLLRDLNMRTEVRNLQSQLRRTTNDLNHAYERQNVSGLHFRDMDDDQLRNATLLQKGHDHLVDSIADKYFTPPKERAWRKLVHKINSLFPWNR